MVYVMKKKIERGMLALVLVALAATLMNGCAESTAALAEPLPATAEGLSGTIWKLDEITLEFGAPPALTITGKATPFGKPLQGQFVVHDGIIEITAMGRTRAGIWNGKKMVIDGVDARFMGKK